MGSDSFGKDSELLIKAVLKDGQTVLEDAYFTAPFKVAKPFLNRARGVLELVLMAASAGIMQGDRYKIKVELGPHAQAALRGQSYSKIHRMEDGFASQSNSFILQEGAFFDNASRPYIPFKDSSYQSTTDCHLDRRSVLLHSEILSCGREKSGESFQFKQFRNCLRVYYGDELIFIDNQYYAPARQNLEGIGFFEGYTHQATLGCFGDHLTDKLLDSLYDILQMTEGIEFGISKTYKFGMVARILGNGGDCLEKTLSAMRKIIYNLVLPDR